MKTENTINFVTYCTFVGQKSCIGRMIAVAHARPEAATMRTSAKSQLIDVVLSEVQFMFSGLTSRLLVFLHPRIRSRPCRL